MNILLLGATGRTGRYVMEGALARRHRVVALARKSQSIKEEEGVIVVTGDPRDDRCIGSAVDGIDVVISCLGQKSSSDSALLTDSAAAVVTALRARTGIPFLVLSQGLLFPSRNPLVALLRFFLRRHVRDSEAMEQVLCNSNIAWEIVRPPRLKDTSARRGYVIAVGRMPQGPMSMERYDLASYLVQEAEEKAHLGEIVGITSG